MSTTVKPNRIKTFLARFKPATKRAFDVTEDVRDHGNTWAINLANSFQQFMTVIFFTAIGALMIFYIGGYPGGIETLLANLMVSMLPGVPFDQAWLALWIGIYISISFFIVFVVMVLRESFEDPQAITIEQIDELREDVDELLSEKDGLLKALADLSAKLDEMKLHL